jgi:DNA-binding transcriptional LysR family regulator
MVGPLLTGLDSIRDVVQQEGGSLPCQLTLITNLRVLVAEVSRATRIFRQLYPAIRLRIDYTGIDGVEPRVLAGGADVALILEPGPDRPFLSATAYQPAGELDYLLVTPPRHALARSPTLHLREIVAHPLVLGELGEYSRHRVREVFQRYSLTDTANIAVETNSYEYTLSCVRAGIGVGITLGNPNGQLHRGLVVRSVRRWFGTARVGFLWKSGVHVPPVQRKFAQIIMDCVHKDAGL